MCRVLLFVDCTQWPFIVGRLLILFSVFAAITRADDLRPCHLDDFHYEYTECDSKGGRWRVSVPKEPGICIPSTTPVLPMRGKECNFACSPGEYLDIQGDQQCHACPAGTYSLGGGQRFDEWNKLPPGFAVRVEPVEAPSNWNSRLKHRGNCSRSEWSPRGNYIMSMAGPCPSSLLFSAKLVKAGKLSFEYQYTDIETVFYFSAQNDQCQAIEDDSDSRWPNLTAEGTWSTMEVDLKTGMNVLQWRTVGNLLESEYSSINPVLIRKIEITGVAYTSECTKCASGTYSSGGAAFCQACPADHFSVYGAVQCQPCLQSEYSAPGSAQCSPRPPCTEYDYVGYQKPCSNGKTQRSYSWIEPQICYTALSGSVRLPQDGPLVECLPCNPGMHRINASHCSFCKPNQFADPLGICHSCPPLTSPNYHIDYKYWDVMPPNLTTHCLLTGMDKCTKTAGWLPSGDHLKTSFGLSDHSVLLVLQLKVGGFAGQPGTLDGKPIALSTVTFDLEITCLTACQLMFMSNATVGNTVIQTWYGTKPRKLYSHDIFTNESLTFTWAFQPDNLGFLSVENETQALKMSNFAKIYSIAVTKTTSGGATLCQACPEGKTVDGCIPCPDGHYVDPDSEYCEPCPFGTILPSSNTWGKDSCKPCGPGLHPVGGRSCKSNCHFVDHMGIDFDFTELDKVVSLTGSRLFTASGTQYYHSFNLSLCNHDNQALPQCVNNITSQSMIWKQPTSLSSMICRSTLIPQGDPDKPVVSTQPVSLGTHLTKIVSNISLHGLYREEGFNFHDTEKDIHFYYDSAISTSACPNGRTSIISLRCDAAQTGTGAIELPPKCTDGTCDGCTFHFLWRTIHACPKCVREDYRVIKGECVHGEQMVHYFPPENCLQLPEEAFLPMTQKCTVLPFAFVVAIPVSIGVGIFLMFLLLYCWSRNKKLEYKYMKLVETSGGHEGELPAADTCGMEDDDEDVHYPEHRVALSFFGKIKDKFFINRFKDDENPFVAVRMSEKMSLT
ncbi:hypothetical protein BsWGS_13596 [Bradybaena similaris]